MASAATNALRLEGTLSPTLGGEAKYVMAAARAKLGDASEAARWLREAIRELPRWASIAG
jgi:hypothetical protein